MSKNLPPSKRTSSRQLRERKHRKLYSEDWSLGDDEDIEGPRSFNIQDKIDDPAFGSTSVVREMHGTELTVAYFQRYGFNTPLLFKEKSGLGLRVPTTKFTINDVRMCVGSRRILDVMDVNTQKNSEMTMKEWQKYYECPNKDKLLNVISLEFSHTKLENYIQSPTVVRQLDWVDCIWPKHLKDSQVEATNLIEDMKYPKVQKYCLMSVKGCYTDFHVDFGGTSVWYHILKGGKIFWLIPPTEHNLALYERWVLSGKQSDIFFGDTVDRCIRIHLQEGNTFFIPTGWIHAVYTPSDSLVFGGNFLHSYGIDKQLKIAQVEDSTKVPQKFRYPFFTEMLWYVLEKYVYCLLGHSHLSSGEDVHVAADRPHIHLTHSELHGLKEIVMYLHMLPANKKNVPDLIEDPIALIQDVRTLIGLHRQDIRELAITGRTVITISGILTKENHESKPRTPSYTRGPYNINKSPGSVGRPPKVHTPKLQKFSPPTSNQSIAMVQPPVQQHPMHHQSPQNNQNHQPLQVSPQDKDKGGPRRRRTRCKKCEACQRSDCGECSFCLDMVKFGGPGRAKQTCNMRQCLQPMLPVTAACAHCGLDGWNQTPVTPLQKGPQRCESASNLMECSVCYEIAHPNCIHRLCPEYTGYMNEDMPNSWECPMCCKMGKNTDYRPRHFRARQKSSDLRRVSISSEASSVNYDGGTPIKHEPREQKCVISDSDNDFKELLPIKKRRTSENSDVIKSEVKKENEPVTPQQLDVAKRLSMRAQLAQQIISNTSRSLKKPMVVVRPAPFSLNVASTNLALDKKCLLQVFKYFTPGELYNCALVCKTWATYSIDPSLWKQMSFTRKHISSDILKGIVRRQPVDLSLDWCYINKFQLPWLIQRLNGLRRLSLVNVNVKTAVSLRSNSFGSLQELDLSFVSDFNDSALREVLGPNSENIRLGNDKERFRNLMTINLSGTDISDISLRYVTQYLPNLINLSLGFCARISDAGVAQLTTKPANTVTNLRALDLSHTKLITEVCLEHLSRCENLVRLDCRHSLNISTQALIKFAAKSDKDLHVKDIKLVELRKVD